MAQQCQISRSNDFGLLAAIGGDCAGAVSHGWRSGCGAGGCGVAGAWCAADPAGPATGATDAGAAR
ncbi:MAG: HipA N-terminal domain-containing protein [Cyanobium sp.]